jgi:hypothetical protein
MKPSWIPQASASLMLLIALNPDNPYSYYTVMRFVCCGCFIFLAILASEQKLARLPQVFGVLAVIYNPLIRIHLDRSFWSVVNIVTICIALASIKAMKPAIPKE